MWWMIGLTMYAAGASVFYAVLMATAQPEPCEAAMMRLGMAERQKAA